jgi:hypothetical protein
MGFSLGSVTANISELKDVWDNLNAFNWSGLVAAVQKVRQAKGNTGTLDRVENYARNAESEGIDFPGSFHGLAQLVR